MIPNGFVTQNLVLELAFFSWFLAQILKVFVNWAVLGKFDIALATKSGGMPSSHSSLVCSVASSLAVLYGFNSPHFTLAAVFSVIVMYDACNVRRAAGEQAKLLNHIVNHWIDMSPELRGKELKELLGHTPLQVFVGAVLGIIIGVGGAMLRT